MELKPGYKQTEVGVIPEDWEVAALGDLIDYTKGYAFKSREYTSDGIRVVRVSDTTYDSILEEGAVYISRTKASQYSKWRLKADDLVVSTVGSKPPMYDSMVGKVVMIQRQHEGALLNQNAVLIRDKKRRPHFQRILLSHLRSKRYLASIESIFRGNANQASITLKELFQFGIPFPSAETEQRAIEVALSDVDALIGALDCALAKKRDLKQAAMQQLLTGSRRLPGFQEEWKRIQAGEIGRFRGGSGFPATFQGATSGTYPFFKVSDMNNQGNETFMIAANNWISEGVRKQLGATAFPRDSIVFAKVGAAVFLERKKILTVPSCLDNNMAAFLLDTSRADCRFVHYLLLHNKLGDRVSTTALPSLSGSVLSKMEFVLPPISEQTAIASVLSDMDAEISALEQRREKTRLLKQGMMQELLTGRTRLV